MIWGVAYSGREIKDQTNEKKNDLTFYEQASSILMYYLIPAMLIFSYILMYSQMIKLFIESRITTSNRVQNRASRIQIIKWIKVGSLIIYVVYFIVQSLYIILFVYQVIDSKQIDAVLIGSIIFFVWLANTLMVVVYCKFAGEPYKSNEHRKNLRKVGYVAAYWTVLSLFLIPLTQ